MPGLHTLRHYEIAWLRHDVVAGLVLTSVLVPVGIAYAVASGLPGICGRMWFCRLPPAIHSGPWRSQE